MDVSDTFYFSARGRGRGSSRRQEGTGARFSIENPRRGGGGLPPQRGGGPEGLGGCLRGIWRGGGWAKYFFPGRNAHQDKSLDSLV